MPHPRAGVGHVRISLFQITVSRLSRFLFLNASTHEPGHIDNTRNPGPAGLQKLCRRHPTNLVQAGRSGTAALRRPAPHRRHLPDADGRRQAMLDATLAATDLVFVSPVYWFPSSR